MSDLIKKPESIEALAKSGELTGPQQLDALANHFGNPGIATLLFTLSLLQPVTLPISAIWGIKSMFQLGERVRAVEQHIQMLAKDSVDLRERLETNGTAISDLRSVLADDQDVQLNLDALGLKNRDIRTCAEAYNDALNADETMMMEAFAALAAHALLGEARDQASLAAVRLLPFMTPDGLQLLQSINEKINQSPGAYVMRGRDYSTEALISLGLLIVEARFLDTDSTPLVSVTLSPPGAELLVLTSLV